MRGVKNPSSGTKASGWTIEITYNGYLVNYLANFDEFPYAETYSPGFIIFSKITA